MVFWNVMMLVFSFINIYYKLYGHRINVEVIRIFEYRMGILIVWILFSCSTRKFVCLFGVSEFIRSLSNEEDLLNLIKFD